MGSAVRELCLLIFEGHGQLDVVSEPGARSNEDSTDRSRVFASNRLFHPSTIQCHIWSHRRSGEFCLSGY